MKTYIQLLIIFLSTSLFGQIQTINTGERSWDYSYYETLGEFSPKNILANGYEYNGHLVWKSDNQLFLYGLGHENSGFWVFDLDIHQWKCLEPDDSIVNWGEMGVFSDSNDPGERENNGITWTDNSGNLYLLNGSGNSYNDLWKYDILLDQWAWIDGYNNSSGTNGNYGEIGQESPDFFPSHRNYASAVSDNNNEYVYIYGGAGGAWGNVKRTDLWRYNTNNNSWTLLYKNPNPIEYVNAQNIVQIGVEDEMNHPGYLIDYTSWYSNGYLWYFSGCSQLLSPESDDCYNQVWKFNISNGLWTCVKFPDSLDVEYGEQGISSELNTPPSLFRVRHSIVMGDDFYFFGGFDPCGYMDVNCTEGRTDNHNSLWKYNMVTNQWTWIKGNKKKNILGFYGKKGEENEKNVPSARHNSFLWSEGNNIFIFGGNGASSGIYDGYFDVWKFNLMTNNFSWVDGKSYNAFQGSFNDNVNIYMEDKSVPSVYNYLGVTRDINWGKSGEKLWRVYDGGNFSTLELAGLWVYDIETSENHQLVHDVTNGAGNYGEFGVGDEANFPPFRNEPLLWETEGKLYLMGGVVEGFTFNDFWEFDKESKIWTWIGGVQNNQEEYNHYGEIGVGAPENFPRSRWNAATWADEFGNLWLYGGANSYSSKFSDFWKYEPSSGLWTLMGGGYDPCNIIEYQLQNDYPSCMERHIGWTKGDDLYFYGGYGIGNNNSGYAAFGDLTDVWKYSISENIWTKVFGNRKINNPTNYGIFQVAQISNEIGSTGTNSKVPNWTDEFGNFWIYRGHNSGDFALWKFDTVLNNWIWMDGTNQELVGQEPYFDYYDYNFFGVLDGSSIAYQGMNKSYLNNAGSLWEIDFGSYPNKFNKIEGTVRFDNQGQCTNESPEISNYKFKLNQLENQYFYSNQIGEYKIHTPYLQNTISPLGFENDYFTVNPASAQADFDSYGNTETIDFCLSPNGQYKDLEIYIIPLQDPRPGFDIDYKIIYKNKGNTTLSGNIEFSFDDTIFEFLTSDPNVDIQNTGVLTWNYEDLHPFESREIMLSLNLSVEAELGGEVEITAVINPFEGDENESDNIFTLSQTIIGSLDPNDKTCLEGESILEEEVGDYVHYLIRFENLGTADAINVVIKDEINTSKFDINTLTPIESSHNFYTKISDNLVEFIFEEINLPFQENLNTGYILFKIKTLESLEAGDEFNNEANIFFDYNEPIVTNNYTTLIEEILSANEELQNSSVKIYPNPTKGPLNIVSDDSISKIEVFDMKGRLILVYNNSGIKDISSLSNGVYIFKVYTKKGMFSYKIIKQ